MYLYLFYANLCLFIYLILDPYSVQEQEEFAKCDHECPNVKHSQRSTSLLTKSFCKLTLFHDPLDPNSNPSKNYGHISSDGHYFNCENPTTRETAIFHIIFILDCSGSMGWNDSKPSHHNNRLGSVYNAVRF